MDAPQSFKAAIVDIPQALNIIRDRSLGPLESGKVQIKITATAINPVDWKMRDDGIIINEYPAVLGSDAAGIIVSKGSQISTLSVGDRVFFQGIIGNYDSSTFQQYCKMPAELVAKTPRNISDEEAAGISLATMAAVVALYDKTGHGLTPPWKQEGDRVGKSKAIVILGGSSSVGQYAIQMARLSGFERIITNASTQYHEQLTRIGAHVILDRDHSNPGEFRTAIGDMPLDLVFDAISAHSTQTLGVQILQATKTTDSTLVTVYAGVPETVDPEAKQLGLSKEPKVHITQILGIGSSPDLRYLSEPLVRFLGGEEGSIAKGLFTSNRPRVVEGGLGAIEEALAANKEGSRGQKVVIRPFDMAE